MDANKAVTPHLTRRGFLISGAAVGLGASMNLSSFFTTQESAAAAVDATVTNASAIYVNFDTRKASAYGVAKTIGTLVSGDGNVSPGGRNLMAPMLPFSGGNVAANTLPTGLEWHGSSAPKTLLSYTADSVRYLGKTTASTHYFGGVRTKQDVVAQGQSVLVSFNADFVTLKGNPNASLLVQLLRTNDSRATLYERAYNAQEDAGTQCIVRMQAPTGGTGGYRVVFMGSAGSSAAAQEATIDISNISIIPEPAAPTVGIRYAVPPYSRTTMPVKNLLLKPAAPAGEYYVLVRTDEFGWGAENVMLTGTSDQIDVKNLFGSTVDITVREAIVIAASKWTTGWMGRVSTAAWTPLRYMNIDNTASLSRVESPNRLARATGLVTTSSTVAPEADNTYPLTNLGAPPETWAASFDASRRSYMAFSTDTAKFIGETTTPSGARSEISFRKSVEFDQHVWTSFWVRPLTTLTDPTDPHKAIFMQFRYTKNATGDSSALGPDLAISQWTNNRLLLEYRTDNGTAVLSGQATPAGISTVQLGPWPYTPGVWNRMVLHTVFSNSGGGYLGFWLNGTKIIDKAVKMGYKRNVGPKLRFGSYKFSESPSKIEIQHLEHGTRDLTSRITRPLPV